jgi:hypothetical protein
MKGDGALRDAFTAAGICADDRARAAAAPIGEKPRE